MTAATPAPRPRLPHADTCAECAAHQREIDATGVTYGPSHEGSSVCRMSRSLASGGDLAHCTCTACL